MEEEDVTDEERSVMQDLVKAEVERQLLARASPEPPPTALSADLEQRLTRIEALLGLTPTGGTQ